MFDGINSMIWIPASYLLTNAFILWAFFCLVLSERKVGFKIKYIFNIYTFTPPVFIIRVTSECLFLITDKAIWWSIQNTVIRLTWLCLYSGGFNLVCTSFYEFSNIKYYYADIGIVLPIKKSHWFKKANSRKNGLSGLTLQRIVMAQSLSVRVSIGYAHTQQNNCK